MKMFIGILRELAGLFVDDGRLALEISLVIAVAAIVSAIAPDIPIGAGVVLLGGCLCVLFSNVVRAKRPAPNND
jgi:hypothetical protein